MLIADCQLFRLAGEHLEPGGLDLRTQMGSASEFLWRHSKG